MADPFTGRATTYDLDVGLMLDIEDMFHLLDPYDTPLYGMYGADGRSAISHGDCFEKKVEWLDEVLLTPRSTLDGSITDSETEITVNEPREHFAVDDIIRVDEEYMRVTDYGSGDNDLEVERGWAGSTAAAHDDGDHVVGVGMAPQEGDDPHDPRMLDRIERYNYTQIFGPHKVEVSGTENVVRKYGLGGTTEFDHQAANRTKEVAVSIEQAILYGRRYENQSEKRRTLGGMDYWITENVDDSTTDLTEDALLDQMEDIYNKGGIPDRATAGSKQKRKASSFNETQIRYDRSNDMRGQVVEYFDTDFGRISFLLNRWVRPSDLFIFSRDQARLETLRPLVFEMLAKTGDSMKGQIVCEKTFKFYRQRHAAKFTNLE